MQAPGTTLKARFVTVQLTLLSIAVALILENLLSLMLGLNERTLVQLLQAVDVSVAAISMWVGFAYGIASTNKPPHLMDFLVHFALLFALCTAVYFIGNGNLLGYFLANAAGTGSACTSLFMDHRLARRVGQSGPVGTLALLGIITLWELGSAALAAGDWLNEHYVVAVLVVPILLQCTAALRSIRFWQQHLRDDPAPAAE
ncbi:MAG: hypothetical protein AAF648_00875 [Pseudomonadota bacterium]